MVPPQDVLVATTLANAARSFGARASGAANGLDFERALYDALLYAHEWRYATPPDQYDLGLPISTRTGTRYEHDGMVADERGDEHTASTVIDAYRKARARVSVDGARVAHELWAALLVAKTAPPPPAPQPAPIPEAYVKAKAALDALVAAIGADHQSA